MARYSATACPTRASLASLFGLVSDARERVPHEEQSGRPDFGGLVQRLPGVDGGSGPDQLCEQGLSLLPGEGQVALVEFSDQTSGAQGRQRPAEKVPGRQNDAKTLRKPGQEVLQATDGGGIGDAFQSVQDQCERSLRAQLGQQARQDLLEP
ncbi:hypothetical protein [Streptomyces cadmiisoli]|uniref:hypothetical protein n=1 Tax=Streptomyces cadmiisoli TaxID=2184053 RepID=UPI0013A69962|nr:hypothetical protein [Streptomyces cadmiisoli]